jgi:hypothetical protein
MWLRLPNRWISSLLSSQHAVWEGLPRWKALRIITQMKMLSMVEDTSVSSAIGLVAHSMDSISTWILLHMMKTSSSARSVTASSLSFRGSFSISRAKFVASLAWARLRALQMTWLRNSLEVWPSIEEIIPSFLPKTKVLDDGRMRRHITRFQLREPGDMSPGLYEVGNDSFWDHGNFFLPFNCKPESILYLIGECMIRLFECSTIVPKITWYAIDIEKWGLPWVGSSVVSGKLTTKYSQVFEWGREMRNEGTKVRVPQSSHDACSQCSNETRHQSTFRMTLTNGFLLWNVNKSETILPE